MASYAVIDKTDKGFAPTFRNVAYDHMAMSRLAVQNGRPGWASPLAIGRV
jgi:hypothetical protein